MACNNGEENATFNSGTLLPENHWDRNLSERAILPGLMTKLGLKSLCFLEDKQDNQYAVVGNARVRNTNTELSISSRVACIKGTFQIQRIMVLSSPVCLLEKCIYGLQQWGRECYFQLWNSPS